MKLMRTKVECPSCGEFSLAHIQSEQIADHLYTDAVAECNHCGLRFQEPIAAVVDPDQQQAGIATLTVKLAACEAANQDVLAENERLRGIIEAFLSPKYNPGGWMDQDDDQYWCNYCINWGEIGGDASTVAHEDTCPVTLARRALERGA